MSDAARSLRVGFDSETDFRREYQSNIANGGIFVATNVGFDVREAVRVEIGLDWLGEAVALEGEIVHVVTRELAGAGATPGVAVQFTLRAKELRERFEPLLGKAIAEDEREAGVGRRAARRATVRVPAWVRTPDGREIEGRTRDLSASGVLVAIGREEVEVGARVGLVIADPFADAELELEGRVVRKVAVPGEGGSAIGVRFEIAPVDAETVAEFVESVRAAEHRRRLGGISGPIAEVGIENVLQMFATCSQKGTLRISSGDDEGVVMFEAGKLRCATLGEISGRKALARLLELREGTFEFEARTDESAYRGDPLPLDAAMLDALRLLDESQRPGVEVLAPNAKLAVDAEKVRAARGELSQSAEAILDLAAVGMTIGKVIDVIPEPDEEIRREIAALIERGLVSLRSDG